MLTRRSFLAHSTLAMLGMAGPAIVGRFVKPSYADNPRDRMPDGSASKGMITPAAERSIDLGLSCLSNQQYRDGSFGTNAYKGNVAVTSLAALAMMAGGNLP